MGDYPDGSPSGGTPGSNLLIRRMGKDLPQHRQIDNMIVDENNDRQWYTGCLPLGLADDKYWLSELQVYLRANFAEAFGATEDDIAAPMHGRNKPIALGQVGIRCMHCKCMYTFDHEARGYIFCASSVLCSHFI